MKAATHSKELGILPSHPSLKDFLKPGVGIEIAFVLPDFLKQIRYDPFIALGVVAVIAIDQKLHRESLIDHKRAASPGIGDITGYVTDPIKSLGRIFIFPIGGFPEFFYYRDESLIHVKGKQGDVALIELLGELASLRR